MSFSARVKNLEQDESLMDFADFRGLKLHKFNKTTLALSGKWILLQDFLNMKVNLKLLKKLGNGYIPMSMINLRNQDCCDLVNSPKWQEIFLKDMFDHTDLPNSCHILPGVYKFTNYIPSVPQNMPVGEYRADVTFIQNTNPVAKYKWFITVQ
ncbi:uncharacterized protein LOC123297794 [Chrysoperla carnea]|uniref:uncharacterized protein LOC123297794 n=1 Tax=Chrysoperla carnea TaxID=189513 RepID=UPI001D070DD9|nr:uncharacterized protein LOC123297794 [Chrysoperla carnea]